MEKFILEMGSDFAFLACQKHFVLDGKDYFMDLLFFHRTLRRLVLIELKLGEFEPQDKWQVELYLRWLEKYERAEGEEKTIALILCAERRIVSHSTACKYTVSAGGFPFESPAAAYPAENLRHLTQNMKCHRINVSAR